MTAADGSVDIGGNKTRSARDVDVRFMRARAAMRYSHLIGLSLALVTTVPVKDTGSPGNTPTLRSTSETCSRVKDASAGVPRESGRDARKFAAVSIDIASKTLRNPRAQRRLKLDGTPSGDKFIASKTP